MICIIAAVAQNGAIGFQNNLLYRLPNDLRRFKSLTIGHTVIMGRRTFDSLPKGALPNRRNIVLSRTVKELPGAEVYPSLESALKACSADEEIFIIGGSSVYAEAFPKRTSPAPRQGWQTFMELRSQPHRRCHC